MVRICLRLVTVFELVIKGELKLVQIFYRNT